MVGHRTGSSGGPPIHKMKYAFIIGIPSIALFLYGAILRDQKQPRTSAPETQTSSRFKLVDESTVNDERAYNGKRTIYILTDKATGREYIGVSGIGISELRPGVKPAMSIED